MQLPNVTRKTCNPVFRSLQAALQTLADSLQSYFPPWSNHDASIFTGVRDINTFFSKAIN